jgi:hypothetical protein
MRIGARGSRLSLCVILVMVAAGAACGVTGGSGGWFRQYEYEEDVYLSLDGTATVYVNTSIAALDALRGTSFDTSPNARFDRDAIRAYYSSPSIHVTRVSPSRRSGRRFVHVRAEVDDIRRLGDAAPFAWATYQFQRDDDRFKYGQSLGAAAGKDVGPVGWTGREIVGFRLHLPSKIRDNNSGTDVRRGNILVWEQTLADRLRGTPLSLEAWMDPQSILYRTLWLFGATFLAVAMAFGLVIWRVLRRGGPQEGSVPVSAGRAG